MKHLIIISLALGLISGQAIAAEKNKNNTYQVVQSEKSFFSSLWGKIKRMIPKKHTVNTTATAVIGVRGAETTESALKPHWEGDLSSDSAFRNDVKQFEDGAKLCESNTPKQGEAVFEALLKSTANDMIKANTLLALASCYAQNGNEEKGRKYLESFVDQYPKHPMFKEVNTWLSASK
jgi:TolA-binding protein